MEGSWDTVSNQMSQLLVVDESHRTSALLITTPTNLRLSLSELHLVAIIGKVFRKK